MTEKVETEEVKEKVVNVAEKVATEVKQKVEQEENMVEQDGITTLASGIRVIFKPVPPYTIQQAQAKIIDPPVPTVAHPNPNFEGETVENPSSPKYHEALAEVSQKRIDAGTNVMILFGMELVDPIPEDNMWLENLLYLDLIDQELDEITSFERQLYYKKYVALDSFSLIKLQEMAGVTEEMIEQARESFQGNAKRT